MILYRTVASLSAAPRTCTTAAGPQPPLHFLPGQEICSETDDAQLTGGGTCFGEGRQWILPVFLVSAHFCPIFYPFLESLCPSVMPPVLAALLIISSNVTLIFSGFYDSNLM